MNSAKGFLAQRGEGLPPRMTAQQIDAVKSAVCHSLQLALRGSTDARGGKPNPQGVYESGVQFARAMIEAALDDYPPDTSCITCDYLHGVTCQHYKQEVPAEARDAGCGNWFADGSPF